MSPLSHPAVLRLLTAVVDQRMQIMRPGGLTPSGADSA